MRSTRVISCCAGNAAEISSRSGLGWRLSAARWRSASCYISVPRQSCMTDHTLARESCQCRHDRTTWTAWTAGGVCGVRHSRGGKLPKCSSLDVDLTGRTFHCAGCCDPCNEKALRASRGAAFKLPLASGSWQVSNSAWPHALACGVTPSVLYPWNIPLVVLISCLACGD